MNQVSRRVLTRCANAQLQHLAIAHRTNIPGGALDQRTTVENVDVVTMLEAFSLEHTQRRFGVWVNPSDDRSCPLRQQAGWQRKLGHQFRDEGLVTQPCEVVGIGKIHLEEVPSQAFPER
ncbi:hypothetical protein D3C86_1645000 [compost metagenome]